MITGIGHDLCSIIRMGRSLQSESFCRRVFGAEEWAMLSAASDPRRPQSAAANFAAKEAFLKAAGVGLGGFPLAEIQCLRRKSGAPYLYLTGSAAEYVAGYGLNTFVSLSHDSGIASAVVVLERA